MKQCSCWSLWSVNTLPHPHISYIQKNNSCFICSLLLLSYTGVANGDDADKFDFELIHYFDLWVSYPRKVEAIAMS